MIVHSYKPSYPGKMKQKGHKFKTGLGYTVGPRSAWATKEDLVSKKVSLKISASRNTDQNTKT